MKAKGLLIVISGPSGVGKGTICSALHQVDPQVVISISATTREPRLGEEDGVHYYFLPPDEFIKWRENGDFLEWAEVYGNFYGTPKNKVLNLLAEGKDVILEIDTKGAMQVKANYPEAVLLFILPPSFEELKKRLYGRETDCEEVILHRLAEFEQEMIMLPEYDYALTNNSINETVTLVQTIILAEKLKTTRMIAERRQPI